MGKDKDKSSKNETADVAVVDSQAADVAKPDLTTLTVAEIDALLKEQQEQIDALAATRESKIEEARKEFATKIALLVADMGKDLVAGTYSLAIDDNYDVDCEPVIGRKRARVRSAAQATASGLMEPGTWGRKYQDEWLKDPSQSMADVARKFGKSPSAVWASIKKVQG